MLLRVEAVALVGLAAVLAAAVPPRLARAGWPARAPRAALALWQAVGLAGGLAILTAGLTLAAADLDRHWVAGLAALPAGWTRLGPLGWTGLAVTLVAGVWLVTVLIASTVRTVRTRRDHRRRLDLLTDDLTVREDGTAPTLVRVLDHPATAAYCLPGLRPLIVVSTGTVATLSPPQLAAVVAHERAHARGRHDLVIHPFRAWRETFAALPAATLALGAVQLLVEMLADDVARLRYGTPALAGALDAMAASPAGTEATVRLARLASPPTPPTVRFTTGVYAAAIALVVLPPLLLALS